MTTVSRALELVRLPRLMELTSGRPEIMVALIDGPVDTRHSGFAVETVRNIAGPLPAVCEDPDGFGCVHGTGVAGILHGRRESAATAICPGCTLLVRSIFEEGAHGLAQVPSATPSELAAAITDSIDHGARVVNVSAGLAQPSSCEERDVRNALDYAVRRQVIVVAAAGNQRTVGGTAITRHTWVIPVVAVHPCGTPIAESNLASSIGRHGLGAPGAGVITLAPNGGTQTFHGTSAATPFVSGSVALLWSLFPSATAADVHAAFVVRRAATIVPPLLDAWGAYERLKAMYGR